MSDDTPTLQNEPKSTPLLQKLRPRRILPMKRDNSLSPDAPELGSDASTERRKPKQPKVYIPSHGSNKIPVRRPVEENDYVYGPNRVYRVVGDSVFFNRFEGKYPRVLQLKNVLAKDYQCIYYPVLSRNNENSS